MSSTDGKRKQLSMWELHADRFRPSSPFFLTSIQSWQWTVWISPAKLTSEANSTTSAASSTSNIGKERRRGEGQRLSADGGQIVGDGHLHMRSVIPCIHVS